MRWPKHGGSSWKPDPKYGAVSEWPPGAACSSISHCQQLSNAISQSTRKWPPKRWKMCLLPTFRNAPASSASLSVLSDINMNVNLQRPRLVNVVNSSIALGFLRGQLQYFQDKGFDVTVLCPERRKGDWEVARPEGVPIIEVPMERRIAPPRDLVSLWRLWRIMRTLRPAFTNVGTPKAGLLGGFAAWLNRV